MKPEIEDFLKQTFYEVTRVDAGEGRQLVDLLRRALTLPTITRTLNLKHVLASSFTQRPKGLMVRK